MREATGELNIGIVVILAIGALIAVFYYTIWPIIKDNFTKNTQCSKAICESCPTNNNCTTVKCHMKNSNETFECVYKG